MSIQRIKPGDNVAQGDMKGFILNPLGIQSRVGRLFTQAMMLVGLPITALFFAATAINAAKKALYPDPDLFNKNVPNDGRIQQPTSAIEDEPKQTRVGGLTLAVGQKVPADKETIDELQKLKNGDKVSDDKGLTYIVSNRKEEELKSERDDKLAYGLNNAANKLTVTYRGKKVTFDLKLEDAKEAANEDAIEL